MQPILGEARGIRCINNSLNNKLFVVGYCFWDGYHGEGMQPLVVLGAASGDQAIEKAKAWAANTLTGEALRTFELFSKPGTGGSIALGAQEISVLQG